MMEGSSMRILIVGQFGGMGGAERSLIPLAKVLHGDGYELTLLLMTPPANRFIFHNFPGDVLIPSGSNFLHRIKTLIQLERAVATTDLVIATSELTPTYFSWLFSRWHNKPILADVQTHLSSLINERLKLLHHPLSRWIYPQISHIRCVSEGVAKDIIQYYKIPPENVSVIYVSFEFNDILRLAQLPIPPHHSHIFDKPTIVATGRLTKAKRFDVAIEALHHLRQSHNIDAHLLILGEGELRPQLEQQIQDLGLTKHVFMPGFMENPYLYMAKGQVFLLSSDYEGFGRVLVEALALGCPVVSTDCSSGPYEVLEGGRCGLLTPTAQPQKITEAIAEILTNPELAQKLSEAGLQRAKNFDTQSISQQYKTLLNQTLD